MPLTVPIQGEILLLQYILRVQGIAPPNPGPVLRLYKNNITLSDTTTGGMLTEATEAGYAPVTCTMWTVTLVSGTTGTAQHSEVTFSFTTNSSIYGYFFTDPGIGTAHILWAETFSGAPFNLPTGGGSISITPKITAE